MTDTTVRPDVVRLIADCLQHDDTVIDFKKIAQWKHADGEPVTKMEIRVLQRATVGELAAALMTEMARPLS